LSPGRPEALIRAWGGPLLITVSVIVVLHDLALFGRLTTQHVDLLPQWLPNYCFLGEAISSGHVPVWTPHVMTGFPFAADPQSGWMYAPAMALHGLLPCAEALPRVLVLHALLAGLGVYAFLRAERTSRVAATLGGLAMALAMAGSRLVLTVPFGGSVAWTAVMLAAAARWVRAGSWAGRIGWTIAVAASWGQVAGAHLSHGLQLATLILAAYVVARRRMLPRGGAGLAAAGLLVAALPLVNLAVLLPRFAYLPRTSLWLGYEEMEHQAAAFSGAASAGEAVGAAARVSWPRVFLAPPGPFMGLLTLALVPLAVRSRPHRSAVVALAAVGALTYALSLRVVANVLRPLPFTDLYIHEPGRFRYGLFLVLPILAALGLEGWRRGVLGRRRVVGASAVVVAVAPFLAGARPGRVSLALAGGAVALLALLAADRRPALLGLLPLILAVDLSAGALIGQGTRQEKIPGLPWTGSAGPFSPVLKPRLDPARYLRTTPLAEAIRGSEPVRFLGIDPSAVGYRGYLEAQEPPRWGLLANQRAVLLGLEDGQGYNPVQPRQWWRFVRASQPEVRQKYNASVFADPPPIALDRLQVGFVIGPAGRSPVPGARPVRTDRGWTLYALDAPPRASLHTSWRVTEDGIQDLLEQGRDPAVVALETDPGIHPGGPGGTASFRWLDRSRARVEVEAAAPAILLVRNQYDPGWEVRIDGRQTQVLRADGFLQAVPVPEGRHVVDLRFRDPWIGAGAAGSGLVLAALTAWALALRRRGRR